MSAAEFVVGPDRVELAHGATVGMEALLELIIEQSSSSTDALAVREMACRAIQLTRLAMSALGDSMETVDSLREQWTALYGPEGARQ